MLTSLERGSLVYVTESLCLWVLQVLGTLAPRERNVLRLRYGLHFTEGNLSLNDVGVAYGLGRERIRQIEEKALWKLQQPWRQQLLRQSLSSVGAESGSAYQGL